MDDARVARVAALYRSGSSTDAAPRPPAGRPPQNPERARAWQAELAKSIAHLERRRR